MVIIYQFGIRRVRLEGGGVLNGTFLKAGLIDKLSILLYPGIDGLSGISSIFEYKGNVGDLPTNGQSLELKNIEKLEAGLIWLQYDVHN
ncbi:dihydrofolate reductase family protein [Empedobacter brevis]|uniref:dihydrofolate reductase family protein n=1 Tax=Empedobacter brevis TaxID=247 RepID=UPI00334146D0